MSEYIKVYADNIESFLDLVIEKAKEGYVRVDSMDLSLGVLTNFWSIQMVKVEEAAKEEVTEEVEAQAKKPGRPAKSKQ